MAPVRVSYRQAEGFGHCVAGVRECLGGGVVRSRPRKMFKTIVERLTCETVSNDDCFDEDYARSVGVGEEGVLSCNMRFRLGYE
jgi:hypothetical protein